MRNSHRSSRAGRPDHDREVAGVGEFRAVAERLLETGAQYLEQGREWLHAATRGQEPEDAYRRERSGAEFAGRRGGMHQHDGDGPYAPDEYSFSETGGVSRARAAQQAGDDDPRMRGFGPGMDERGRRRARGAHPRSHEHPHRPDGDGFLPGSYGFGGEGRRQGDATDQHDFEQTTDSWERAYRAQAQGSHRGRGPRGYVRSDERILEDVNERLCDDPIVDATDIEVHCDQGRVIMEGRVPTRWMKHRAEDIADSVRGARDIENRIRVSAEEPVPRGDFDTSRTTGAHADHVRSRSQESQLPQTGSPPAAAHDSRDPPSDDLRGTSGSSRRQAH